MPSTHSRFLQRGSLAASLCLCLLAWSCSIDTPCDPGQVLDRNYCVELPEGDGDGDGAATGGNNAGGEAAVGGEGGEATTPEPEPEPEAGEFGRICTTGDDCDAPAPYCAISPFSEDGKGVCSAQGCDTAGVECPEGWSCLDFADTCTED